MLEIKCKKNSDGTFSAGVFNNGDSVDPTNFSLKSASCEEIRELQKRVLEAFPTAESRNKWKLLRMFLSIKMRHNKRVNADRPRRRAAALKFRGCVVHL